jgi:hypothetical protein
MSPWNETPELNTFVSDLSYRQMVQLSKPGEIREEYEAELRKVMQQIVITLNKYLDTCLSSFYNLLRMFQLASYVISACVLYTWVNLICYITNVTLQF